MPEPLQTIIHKEFLGLRSSIADPPSNSAKNMSNLVLHRRRGILEQADGYGLKFPDGVTDLPQVTDATKPNYIDPAIHKITALTWENIHNFFVPDHGGRNITVAVGKYTKASFFPISLSTDQFGIWVRPWYDSVQELWSDDPGWNATLPRWQELTEFQVFELLGLQNGSVFTLQVDGVTFANDTSIGISGWINFVNAKLDDSIATYCWVDDDNRASNYLMVGGINLATLLPAGSTIAGIEVYIKRRRSVGNNREFIDVARLTKNGVLAGPQKNGSLWPETYETFRYGSPTDNWNAGITQADTLGVAISGGYLAGRHLSTTAEIDHVYFKIYYYSGSDAFRLTVNTTGTKYRFREIDVINKVFNDDYFKDWTLVYNQLEDSENYDLIRNCGYDGADYFLELFHPNSDFASRTPGTKLIAYRNFIFARFPLDISSFIYNLLAEIRLTTGNGTGDISVMAGFRTKSLTVIDQSTSLQYPLRTDALVCDAQTMDFWRYATLVAINLASFAPAADPLPAKTYHVKYALRLDDASITRLYDAKSVNAGVFTDVNNVVLDGSRALEINVYRSFGAFPRRGKSVVVFVSDDNLQFAQVSEIDLTVAATFNAVSVANLPTGKHFYAVGQTRITKSMWASDNPESTIWTDKADEDDGIIRYKHGLVLAPNIYAVGVRDASLDKVLPNQIFVSAIAGDGARQYDVFPNDPTHVIDLEFSDGDEVVGLASIDQTIIAIKRRAIVAVSKDRTLGYVRQFVTRGYGIASVRTLVSWDDLLYWLDYNGVIRFSTRGINVVNYAWLQDLRNMSDIVKEAAFAVIDRVNRQYRLTLNGRMYIMDLDTGEWTIEDYVLLPERFAVNVDGVIDFINGNSLESLSLGSGQQDGSNFSVLYETNEVQHPESDEDIDLNVIALYVRYQSDVDLTLRLFKNATTEEIGGSPWTLLKAQTRVRVKPIEARCSSFRLQLSATTTATNQNISILRLGAKYQSIAAGGTELTE